MLIPRPLMFGLLQHQHESTSAKILGTPVGHPRIHTKSGEPRQLLPIAGLGCIFGWYLHLCKWCIWPNLHTAFISHGGMSRPFKQRDCQCWTKFPQLRQSTEAFWSFWFHPRKVWGCSCDLSKPKYSLHIVIWVSFLLVCTSDVTTHNSREVLLLAYEGSRHCNSASLAEPRTHCVTRWWSCLLRVSRHR